MSNAAIENQNSKGPKKMNEQIKTLGKTNPKIPATQKERDDYIKNLRQKLENGSKKRQCPRKMETIDHLQGIVDETSEFLELKKPPRLRMKEKGRRAFAQTRKWYISCPWTMLNGNWNNRYAWVALMVHETAHFGVEPRRDLSEESCHGKFFKEVEALALAYWSLQADRYGKAYACRYRTLSGKLVWFDHKRFNSYTQETQDNITATKKPKKKAKAKKKKSKKAKAKPMTLRKARLIWREVATQHGFRGDVEIASKAVLKPDDACRAMKSQKITTDYPGSCIAVCVWPGIVVRSRTNPDKLRKSIEDWFLLLSLQPAA